MGTKEKKRGGVGWNNYLGTSLMSMSSGLIAGLMSSWFMLYLTDYAGIGKWGAILGSSLLFGMRIFDAVNDPIEAWIIDRAKVGKHGKYKPFIILSIILSAISTITLFSIPSALDDHPVLICVWIIVAYLVSDIGGSFMCSEPLYRTISIDPNERAKIMIGPRFMAIITGAVSVLLFSIINAINGSIHNMSRSFSIAVSILILTSGIISLVGILLVKEKYHTPSDENDVVKITDIFRVIGHNKALRTRLIELCFTGFIYTFMMATSTYYVRWAYCANLQTGEVNSDLFATYSVISGILAAVPMVLGVFLSAPLMKKIGSTMKTYRTLLLIEVIPLGILAILQFLGLLQSMPAVYFAAFGIALTCMGLNHIPGATLNLEIMDYEIYSEKKDRSALIGAAYKFLDKLQNAASSGVVGVMLALIGYEMDSATDTYIGDLSALPGMLTWFIVIMGLLPFILGICAQMVLRKYPITDDIRADMQAKLKANCDSGNAPVNQ